MQDCVVGVGPELEIAVARRFAREGYRLALIARTPEKLDLADLEATTYAADAASQESLEQAFATIERDLGPVDVLVYNAAEFALGRPGELQPADFAHSLMVNVAGAFMAVHPASVTCVSGAKAPSS